MMNGEVKTLKFEEDKPKDCMEKVNALAKKKEEFI